MKRFLIIILLGLMSTTGYAQLQIYSLEDLGGYHTVYSYKVEKVELLTIRYNDYYGYVLLAQSDNIFARDMHSVYLGHNKETAIKSLRDIKYLDEIQDYGDLVITYSGFGDRYTTLYRDDHGLILKTEEVLGCSPCLQYIDYKKAINSIVNFSAEEE